MSQVLQAKTVNKWYRGNHAVISVHYNNLNASVLFYISFPFYQHTFFISSLFYLTNLSICVSLSLCYHFLLWLKERKKVFNLCCKSILTTKQSTSCRAKLAPEKCFLFAAQKHFKRKFCIWIFVMSHTPSHGVEFKAGDSFLGGLWVWIPAVGTWWLLFTFDQTYNRLEIFIRSFVSSCNKPWQKVYIPWSKLKDLHRKCPSRHVDQSTDVSIFWISTPK